MIGICTNKNVSLPVCHSTNNIMAINVFTNIYVAMCVVIKRCSWIENPLDLPAASDQLRYIRT